MGCDLCSSGRASRCRTLVSWAGLLLAVSNHAAAQGVTTAYEAKLRATVEAPDNNLGNSVAISGDTVVAGAILESVWSRCTAMCRTGAAYVFVRSGGVWVQQQKLLSSDLSDYDALGSGVAIQGDVLVLGASGANTPGAPDSGAAYVFEREGNTWVQTQKLIASDAGTSEFFGNAVAMDGDRIAIAASARDSGLDQNQGAIYVFVRTGDTWIEEAILAPADLAFGDLFGDSVAIDGDTIVAGAIGQWDRTINGRAYVYVRGDAGWELQQVLEASDGAASDRFGSAVAIYGDRIAVGANYADYDVLRDVGSVYVFERTHGVWSETQELDPIEVRAEDAFGSSLALGPDLLIAGAKWWNSPDHRNTGAAYVYALGGGEWVARATLVAPDGDFNDFLGSSVAVDGKSTVMGAPGDESGAIGNAGSAHVFHAALADGAECVDSVSCEIGTCFEGVCREEPVDPGLPDAGPEDGGTVEVEDAAVEVEDAAVEVEDASVEVEDAAVEVEDASVEVEDASVEVEDASVPEPGDASPIIEGVDPRDGGDLGGGSSGPTAAPDNLGGSCACALVGGPKSDRGAIWLIAFVAATVLARRGRSMR